MHTADLYAQKMSLAEKLEAKKSNLKRVTTVITRTDGKKVNVCKKHLCDALNNN